MLHPNLPGIFSNTFPHGENNCSSNQAIFDDEWEKVGSGKFHNVPHDVITSASEVVG